LLATLALCAACGSTSGIDPNEGAFHLQDLGRRDAFGRNPNASPVTRVNEDSGRTVATGGKWSGDIDALEAVLGSRWSHRRTHKRVDGIKLGPVMDALREEATVAAGRPAYRRAVSRALCRLGDGNLQIDREPKAQSDTGLSVRAVGETLLVESVDDRYGSAVRPGDLILAVDGMETTTWIRTTCRTPGSTPGQRVARFAMMLEQASSVRTGGRAKRIKVRGAKRGKVRDVELRWTPAKTGACVEGTSMADDVGVVKVHDLGCDPATFDQQLDQAFADAGTQHVLLDLRRTRGNDEANAQSVAARFVPEATVWATVRTGGGAYENEPLSAGTATAPQGRWVMASARCANACELLTSVAAAQSGVTVVGKTTAGAVARPEPVAIGQGLRVRVPTSVFALPGTTTGIEARGVQPDVEVTATIDDLAQRRDPELIAIARRIRG
ncbi:MAG: S41 family peptidase, partial [Myxococcota bacterium]